MSDRGTGISRAVPGADDTVWSVLGFAHRPRAVTEDVFAFEIEILPGMAMAVHRHPEQSEGQIVLEGQVRMRVGDDWTLLGTGDVAQVPRGVAHGFFNDTDAPARMLVWITPPGRLAELLAFCDATDDLGAVIAALPAHGFELVDPEDGQ